MRDKLCSLAFGLTMGWAVPILWDVGTPAAAIYPESLLPIPDAELPDPTAWGCEPIDHGAEWPWTCSSAAERAC